MEKRCNYDASVEAILKEMTLLEKAQMVTGETTYGTKGLERFQIPSALLQDAGNGVNLRQYLSNLLNTGKLKNENIVNRYGGVSARGMISELVHIMDHVADRDALDEDENKLLDDFLDYIEGMISAREFPNAMPCNSLLAATWDREAVLECGRIVGREASAYGIDCLLGTPCINIQRDPLGGRGFECYSEDPYLVSELAPWHCIGVQEAGVPANVKHLAVNSQETNRKTINEIVSERALREIYLPAFKACVQKGKIRSVMTGYNWINGEACAHSKWMLQDVLRNEWGFDGCVMSDWGGVYDQIQAVQAGNDLTMPKGDVDAIVQAVKHGQLSEEQLDNCVRNVLGLIMQMPATKGRAYSTLDNAAARRAAYRAASEGMVLLKNEGALPLSIHRKTAFYGKRCCAFEDSGVGSGRVHTDKTSHMNIRAEAIAGKEQILYHCVDTETQAVVVTIFARGQEGQDRVSFEPESADVELVREAYEDAKRVGAKVILLLNVAGPINLSELEPMADAILCMYFPGEEGGNAAADILYGRVNPSGKLPHTFPRRYCDTPSFGNFPGENKTVYYGEGILVGYRWYDTRKIEPLYCFGHGLSYTSFAVDEVRLSSETPDMDRETLTVYITVRNTGSCKGREVLQLYVHDEQSTLFKPVKELKGFTAVELEPGERQIVTLVLDREAFSSWDPELHRLTCEPGGFKLMIGDSSRHILAEKRVRVCCENPYAYGENTSYRTLIEDERSLDVIAGLLPEGTLTRKDLEHQMIYFGQTMGFRQAYPQYISMYFHDMSEEEKWELFDKICAELKKIDVSEYSEKETY